MRKFDAQQPVRWLSPKEIVRGASGQFFGGLFSKYADNRDRQALSRKAEVYCHPLVTLPSTAPVTEPAEPAGDPELSPTADMVQGPVDPVDPLPDEMTTEPSPTAGLTIVSLDGTENTPHGMTADGDYIIDYVADIGDGFGATYAVAEAMARDSITVEGDTLPRGSMLILGGDQVYPVANELDYDNRTVGPYLLAYDQHSEPDETIPVYAIPGNHDWYDGLDAFLRIFTNDGGIYRRQSRLTSIQSRSYFALALPHNWWIWGVDTGLTPGGRLDLRQIDYFKNVFKLMSDQTGPEPRVIVCTAEPCWIKRTRGDDEPIRTADGWDHLIAFFESVTARATDKDPIGGGDDDPPWWRHVRLIISGDKHFYVRHEPDATDPDPHPTLISSGGGGAYLSSTWEIRPSVTLNMESLAPNESTSEGRATTFRADPIWPSPRTSLRMGLMGLVKVPAMNPMLAALIGVLYGLFTYAFVAGQIQPTFRPDLAQRLSFVDQVAPEASEQIPLVVALMGIDESCYLPFGERSARCPETSVFSQLASGALENFGTFVIGALMLGALWLFAAAGYRGFLKTTAAWLVHGALHVFVLALTITISISIVVDRPSDAPFRRWPVWAVLGIAALILAVPIGHRRFRYQVTDLGGVHYALVPPLLILVLLQFLGESTSPQTGAVAIVVAASIIGGALGTSAITAYMVLSQFFKVHLNELFAGIRSEKYKQFIRLVFSHDQITAYSIGYEKTIPRTVNWVGHNGAKAAITSPDMNNEPRRVDRFVVRR